MMRLFLDTEFTSPETKQLISIGIISEDGQHSFYGELNDYDTSLCNRFVCENVLPHMEHKGMSRDQLAFMLREWFATLPRRVFFSCDSYDDIKLVWALLGERPANLIENWLDLRSLIDTTVYHNAVEAYHTPDKPWHHALHDAAAHRAGWLAWMDHNKTVPVKPDKRAKSLYDNALNDLLALRPGYFQKSQPIRSWLPRPWLNLAIEMLDELEVLSPGFQLEFIKESFGGMAASIDDGAPVVRALLQDYFDRSKKICVVCGKPLHYSEEETHAVLQLFKCVVCTDCKPKFGSRPLYG